MTHKKKILLIAVISLLGLGIALILTTKGGFGLCTNATEYCFEPYDETIGQTLGMFALSILFILSILFFLHERIFRTWAWFALVYLPIAAILIATTPSQCDAPVNLCGDRELVNWFLASLFLLSSLTLITVKFFKLRKNTSIPASR